MSGRMKTSNHLVVGFFFEETLEPQVPLPRPNVNWQKQLWALFGRCSQVLLRDGSEPRIRQITDRTGQTYWQVYDPQCQRCITCTSEDEIRQWFEQRYSSPITA